MEMKTVEEIAAYLGQCSSDIPVVSEQRIQEENAGWKQKRFLAFALPSILLAAGITGLILGLINYRPLDKGALLLDSFKYSLPLLVLFIWGAIKLLKGRSSSHRELMAASAIALFGFIFAGIGGEMTLNGLLDKSQASVHQAKVINKYYSKKKNNHSYYAVVESWRTDHYSEKIKVNSHFYQKLQPGQSTMVITTKPGALGFEWLVDYQ